MNSARKENLQELFRELTSRTSWRPRGPPPPPPRRLTSRLSSSEATVEDEKLDDSGCSCSCGKSTILNAKDGFPEIKKQKTRVLSARFILERRSRSALANIFSSGALARVRQSNERRSFCAFFDFEKHTSVKYTQYEFIRNVRILTAAPIVSYFSRGLNFA